MCDLCYSCLNASINQIFTSCFWSGSWRIGLRGPGNEASGTAPVTYCHSHRIAVASRRQTHMQVGTVEVARVTSLDDPAVWFDLLADRLKSRVPASTYFAAGPILHCCVVRDHRSKNSERLRQAPGFFNSKRGQQDFLDDICQQNKTKQKKWIGWDEAPAS